MTGSELPGAGREQLLVVSDPGKLAQIARRRYPQFEVTAASTYFEGIAALSGRATRGLLVGVDPSIRRLPQAVAGLRKAAGNGSRLVLCCHPSNEPAARQAMSAGADDYVIYPPSEQELDAALAVAHEPAGGIPVAKDPVPTWEELEGLTEVMGGLFDGRLALLKRVCQVVADGMRTSFVRVIADNDVATVGDADTEPVLVETIPCGGKELGTILIGPRQREPFSASEAQKVGHYARMIGHLLDAAEQQDRWRRLALIDEVTQLPNRRYLTDALQTLLHRARTERFCVTVMIFDLDGFKHFNDTYGHAAGDQVLRETAQLLRRHSRKHDVVARYAGDEFVAVFWDAEEPRLAGSKHPSSPLEVLRRFRSALESHDFPALGPERQGHVTVSAGLATFPWDGDDMERLLEQADQAMLEAKRDGKNRIYLIGSEPGEKPRPAEMEE